MVDMRLTLPLGMMLEMLASLSIAELVDFIKREELPFDLVSLKRNYRKYKTNTHLNMKKWYDCFVG